ncbi:pyridoxine/pyridoxamine 5'-phosphate oxidase 2 isoform X2 [Abrus precatorius]|uniref:pyridoxal 5'-phosphate synthase n=1 Tax=Abrus precatorius TaxID=3816 RepID=A0A8B8JVQ5_ABRPR|nr:pyridoxine/pyridoxamine 5'-phosphate oxidase 2 isoform X2 [Abrus precatorius]
MMITKIRKYKNGIRYQKGSESEMGSLAWKQLLLNALESNSHLKHSSFISFATVGTNGTPSNRTVVFRGFQDNTDNIQIHTDARTRKIEELKLCSSAEICWYFTDSWEQFRINGKVDIIDGSNPDPLKLQQRENSWFASSLRSRSQYLWPNPGLPCLNEQAQPEISLDPSTGPVDAFCLLILEPNQVDYLNLKSNQRLTFKSSVSDAANKNWVVERVNP